MSLKSYVSVLAGLLAALAAQGAWAAADGSSAPAATSHSAGTSADTSEKLQEVTVTAHRIELEKRVSKFVNQIAATENEEGLPRWQKPVCPLVSGLPEQEGEFVLGRVSEIARAAGVPLAGEQCRPNLFVWVTSHPKELLQGLENRNFQFRFGADALPTVVDEFIATPRAVRVWYSSDIEDRWGSPVTCQFANIRVRASCHAEATHILFNTIYVFGHVFVIVDQTRLAGVSRGQFADYVALVGLAKLKPGARLDDVSTILKLFDGAPEAAPAGMTDWDQAFLKSLYSTDQISKQQRSQIARQMAREIAP
jgi:hypothetical protein